MLKNMENARAVLGKRFKAYAEQLVFRIVVYPNELCACIVMGHFHH